MQEIQEIDSEKATQFSIKGGPKGSSAIQNIKNRESTMPHLKYFLDLISVPSLILSLKPRQNGSFAAESPLHFEPTKLKLTGMIEDIIAMGTQTRTRILKFGFVHPPKKVRENLRLNGDAKVLGIERIRFIKGQPISYTVSFIPSDLGAKIHIKDLVVQPLMNVLEDKCKIKIVKGSQVIGATVADTRVASFLEVMTGSPLLKIERVAFDARNRPVEYISILYRSDRYHFNVDFIRKRSESKDRWDYINP
jgi:DNA-binding GntR family transcriptional regulator